MNGQTDALTTISEGAGLLLQALNECGAGHVMISGERDDGCPSFAVLAVSDEGRLTELIQMVKRWDEESEGAAP